MDYNNLFERLNNYQKSAVECDEKYLLLNASVGSGKTTVLVHKILYLNLKKEIPLKDIIVLTFTNKAAGEIQNRVKDIIPDKEDEMLYFGTFHSVAMKLLKSCDNLESLGYSRDFKVIDSEESFSILEDLINKGNYQIKYKNKLKKRIDELKNGNSLYGIMKKEDDIVKLNEEYIKEKKRQNLMDFDDLIDISISALDNPVNPKWIIIDEFQDTDYRQFELIKKIAGENTHIFAVGDPYQIIYSWRTGANKIFDKYKEEFKPLEYSLPINYRSSRTIIEAASNFIGCSKIEGVRDYGNPIVIRKNYDSFNEALYFARKIKEFHETGVPFGDFGILYRRKQQGELIKNIFDKEGIPAKIIFKSALVDEENSNNEKKDEVSLLTLHGAKGLEFSHVFIAGVNMGNIPLSTRRDDEDEEARLFFVGITRAKNYLILSYVTKPDLPGETKYQSPYISMIPKNLVIREEEGESVNLKDLINEIRSERDKKKVEEKQRKIKHNKYGDGIIIYENDDIIRINFEIYGEKEFSKMFFNYKDNMEN